MSERLSHIQQKENDFLVGRDRETDRYLRFLTGESLNGKNVWNVYGTGGVGKSTLLDTFRRMSIEHDCVFLYVDSRDFHHSPDEMCRRMLLQCTDKTPIRDSDEANPLEACLVAIKELSRYNRVAIAFDTYEEMDDLDPWLREHVIQWLPEQVLVILAGRHPLKGAWQLSPAWRERVERFPLGSLNRDQTLAYLRKCRIATLEKQERVWSLTKGHPLALSLSASAFAADTVDWDSSGGEGWFDHLVELWLREVPDQDMRQWVETASVQRQFDQESLSFISGEAITSDRFTQSCRLSFVRKADRGWALHDLMRDATNRMMKERSPTRYRILLERCAAFYQTRILQAPRDGSAAWEMGQLFSYIGDATILWLLSPSAKGQYYWEPLTEDNVNECEQYIRRRNADARPLKRTEIDPKTKRTVAYELDIHFELSKLNTLNLRAYLAMGQEIAKLLRTKEGKIVGLSVIYPIHSGTMPYLLEDPLASPYFNSLVPSEYKHFLVASHRPAGWFIRVIDIEDSADATLTMEAMSLLFSLMVSDGVLIASPPPHPIFIQPHLNMGFQEVPNVTHCFYDGKTPTSTYALDTRGNKLHLLLDSLLQKTGMKGMAPTVPENQSENIKMTHPNDPNLLKVLTEREKEVTNLVLQGMSNAEIAATLYISEVTVKKHLHSVYEKLQVSNRNQLLRLLLTK